MPWLSWEFSMRQTIFNPEHNAAKAEYRSREDGVPKKEYWYGRAEFPVRITFQKLKIRAEINTTFPRATL